jgi:hypothetical protein
MYFSGVDGNTIARIGNTELDLNNIQFSNSQQISPVYGFFFKGYLAGMDSTAIVQGTLTLNYDDGAPFAQPDGFDLEIILDKTALELNNDGIYANVNNTLMYIIRDIQIISKTHAIYPASQNIVEVIQFIATTYNKIVN